MSELEKYELVNKAENFDRLIEAIVQIGAESGDNEIMGRRKPFTVENQLRAIEQIRTGWPYNALTRSYGIRQQMMYLMHYGDL